MSFGLLRLPKMPEMKGREEIKDWESVDVDVRAPLRSSLML